jgi:purine-binding chemotaxis protein CheW
MDAVVPIRCCTFRIGPACFAVPTASVVEVLRGGRLARVPQAPESVLGLMHLRGRIVPVVDPAARLGIDRPAEAAGTHLVIAVQDEWYGLAIDDMLDVVDIPAAAVEPAGGETTADAVAGVYAAPDRLVHVLDPGRTIHSLVRPRPQSSERQGSLGTS